MKKRNKLASLILGASIATTASFGAMGGQCGAGKCGNQMADKNISSTDCNKTMKGKCGDMMKKMKKYKKENMKKDKKGKCGSMM